MSTTTSNPTTTTPQTMEDLIASASLKASTKHATAEELASKYRHRIRGKTVVVTGASPGSIGAEFCKSIAVSSPAMIVLAGRSLTALARTAAVVKAANPDVLAPVVELDLGSLASVRKAAAEVNQWVNKIDTLVLSAGIMAVEYGLTEDGFEQHFGSNHLGHFLLTNLLMPKILAADRGARIVSVSSDGHTVSAVRFDDLSFDGGKSYEKWTGYAISKTANALFAVELAKRLKEKNVQAFSVHPGVVPTGEAGSDGTMISGIGRHMLAADYKMMGIEIGPNGEMKVERPEIFKTLGEGAASHVYAAFDPEISGSSGSYIADVHIANDMAAEHAKDPVAADKLWRISEEMVGEIFVV